MMMDTLSPDDLKVLLREVLRETTDGAIENLRAEMREGFEMLRARTHEMAQSAAANVTKVALIDQALTTSKQRLDKVEVDSIGKDHYLILEQAVRLHGETLAVLKDRSDQAQVVDRDVMKEMRGQMVKYGSVGVGVAGALSALIGWLQHVITKP